MSNNTMTARDVINTIIVEAAGEAARISGRLELASGQLADDKQVVVISRELVMRTMKVLNELAKILVAQQQSHIQFFEILKNAIETLPNKMLIELSKELSKTED